MSSHSARTRLQGWLGKEISGSAALVAICGGLVAAVGFVLVWIQPRAPDGADPSIALASMLEAAQKLHQDGRYDDACSLADRAVRLSQARFGGDHPATAHAMNEFAVMCIAAGRYQGVEEILQKVLAVHTRVYGSVSPDVAVAIHNLALLSEQMAKFSEAEQRYVQAIEAYAQATEPNPGIAQSLNNLAALAEIRGDYVTAEQLHRRALEVRQRLLGYSHFTTAESMANLATILLKQGKIPMAERLQRRALAIREHVLGPTHVATASSMNGLASTLLQQREIDAADALAVGALAVREHVYGNQHPATASSLETLARVRQLTDEPMLAKILLDRALAIRIEKNGPNHPKTADTLVLLGEFFANVAEDHQNAADAYARAVAIRSVAFGENNSQTIMALEKQYQELLQSDRIAESEVIEKKLSALKGPVKLPAPEPIGSLGQRSSKNAGTVEQGADRESPP